METTELLLVGAEICVAFTGFAGIIATFQFGGDRQIKRGDIVGLTMIVQISLMSAMFCVAPMVLRVLAFEDKNIWLVCSALGVIWMASNSYTIDKNMRGAVRSWSIRLFFGSLQGISALLILCLVLNAANVIFHREPGPYVAAIFYGVCLTGYMFGRLLLRPLWKSVREQEALSSKGAAGI